MKIKMIKVRGGEAREAAFQRIYLGKEMKGRGRDARP